MNTKIKKIAASVMAAATLAVGTVGMTASAYSPTITKSFGHGAIATLYADGTKGIATTTKSQAYCTAKLTYNGTTTSNNGYGKARICINGSGSTSAHSIHYADSAFTSLNY